MEVRFHQSVEEFRAAAYPRYRRDPVTNTIELTTLRGPAFPADSVFLSVVRDSKIAGAAMQTPPRPLLCNGLSATVIDCVTNVLAQKHPDLVGVLGFRETATEFAEVWRTITGSDLKVEMEQRLYRLESLSPPTAVPGAGRQADGNDAELLVDWLDRFSRETFGSPPDPEGRRRFIDRVSALGDRIILWTVEGRPVSMAAAYGPVAAVSRIGTVYTPEDQRGKGFGSAVSAAAARAALDCGSADVVLFTDLANPVSNSIYQRIGFSPVSDSAQISFTTPHRP
jgi:predicted GNAT family acetyltransferase